MENKGYLYVVGTGLNTLNHITQEAKRHIAQSEHVFHLVPDPLGLSLLKSLNSNLHYLGDCYALTTDRIAAYQLMVKRVMTQLTTAHKVCVVFYGHPGIFVSPSHALIQQAKEQGYVAQMLPGISAEDCLFSDLGIDPASAGCQSYEASYFLLNQVTCNVQAPLILWQLGVLGDFAGERLTCDPKALELLQQKLGKVYPPQHPVTLYEAATLSLYEPRIETLPLAKLTEFNFSQRSTLFIPACSDVVRDESIYLELKKHQLKELNNV
ncbi:MAG: methylase [Gammaproteobacteria bacterium]|nr:methylase [Gammaproteobacteria bacterium]NVK88788.1 methylase [Gammaproteobacteria bacterium]